MADMRERGLECMFWVEELQEGYFTGIEIRNELEKCFQIEKRPPD